MTQADIDQYINTHAEESTHLEFKRGDALAEDERARRELAKDVAAFANADGGVIIYGITEKDHKADSLSFIDGNRITKEWIEQLVASRISRKIPGLVITPIRYDQQIAQTIFAVTIPRSPDAPHMADKRFYRRYNFQVREMEEYEVRDLYQRRDLTSVALLPPTIKGSVDSRIGDKLSRCQVTIDFNLENKGKSIETLYKLEIRMPGQLVDRVGYHHQPIYKHLIRKETTYWVFAVPGSSPVFQNEKTTIASLQFVIDRSNAWQAVHMQCELRLYYSNGTEELNFIITRGLAEKKGNLGADDFIS